MKGTFLSIVFCVCWVVTGCTTPPAVKIFIVEEGARQYFVPPTEWRTINTGKITAKLDITYRDTTESEAIVNVSFTGRKDVPHKVSSAALYGDGALLPLKSIKVIYLKPGVRELRISSGMDREDLMAVLAASAVELGAVIDGEEYRFAPSKEFSGLRAELHESLVYGH
ncbi:MAG: hypothetical protein LBP23_03760 [Treponema sp.]|jgi:hypothetical protein|nr:hypothetical protein [Treponema sp.]